MDRLYTAKLNAWKESSDRKPLVLLGARQVGKTHLLETFGADFFEDMVYLNFEENKEIHSYFDDNIKPKKLISALEIYLGVKINPEITLIIFDEIQECPRALTSLKYFCEQASEYYIAAAGSLLGLTISKGNGFPVGKVQLMTIYPMSFFEFLNAIGKNMLADYLHNISTIEPLPDALHNQAMELIRLYTFVGGMPEAVKKYRDSEDLSQVREVQKQIIKTYQLDFSKHAEGALITRLADVWNVLAAQLAKENKKFIFSVIRNSARAREYEQAIQWLINAGIVYRCNHLHTPKMPLKAYMDSNIFKLYLLDVGVLGALSDLPAKFVVQNDLIFSEFKGALTENLVVQQLRIAGQENFYYWTSGNTAEIDFITTVETNILPLEVKSGSSKMKKSLRVYQDRYQPEISVRVSPRNLKQDGQLINYPFYLVERFPIE